MRHFHLLFFLFFCQPATTATPPSLLHTATTAFNQRQYRHVVQLVTTLPKSPALHISTTYQLFELLGQSYDALHKEQSALDTYEKLLTLQAQNKLPQRSMLSLNGLGLILSRRPGQGQRAIDLMVEASLTAPNNHGLRSTSWRSP